MPEPHENLPDVADDSLDADIFEFDRNLNEIASKIDAAMRKINAQYPEKTNADNAENDFGE